MTGLRRGYKGYKERERAEFSLKFVEKDWG